MLLEHADAWLSPLPDWARPQNQLLWARGELPDGFGGEAFRWARFRRGFLDGAGVRSIAKLLDEGDILWKMEPVIDLYIGGPEGEEDFELWEFFPRLRALRFGHYFLGPGGTELLSELPELPNLPELDLYKNELEDPDLTILAKCPISAHLRILELGFNNFTSRGARSLAASKYLKHLEYLGLQDNQDFTDKTRVLLKQRFGKALSL